MDVRTWARGLLVSAFLLSPLLVVAASALEGPSAMTVHRIELDTADRIQQGILDHVLGPGRSSVFVRLSLGLGRAVEVSEKRGVGMVLKKGDAVERGTDSAAEEDAQRQEARQIKTSGEERISSSLRFTAFSVVVLHEAGVSLEEIEAVRDAVLAAYGGEDLKPENIKFKAVGVWKKSR